MLQQEYVADIFLKTVYPNIYKATPLQAGQALQAAEGSGVQNFNTIST